MAQLTEEMHFSKNKLLAIKDFFIVSMNAFGELLMSVK